MMMKCLSTSPCREAQQREVLVDEVEFVDDEDKAREGNGIATRYRPAVLDCSTPCSRRRSPKNAGLRAEIYHAATRPAIDDIADAVLGAVQPNIAHQLWQVLRLWVIVPALVFDEINGREVILEHGDADARSGSVRAGDDEIDG